MLSHHLKSSIIEASGSDNQRNRPELILSIWPISDQNQLTLLNKLIYMNITQVREHLHRLIDEIDDIYVLNGLYRNLLSEKRQRDAYEKEQAERAKRQSRSGGRSN